MRFLKDLFSRGSGGGGGWDIDTVTPPWGDRPSIYAHVQAHVRPGVPGLAPGGDLLPDEEVLPGRESFRWAPGALDGSLGRHSSPETSQRAAEDVADALAALLERTTDARAGALYDLLTEDRALNYVDELIPLIGERSAGMDAGRLHAVARWLATRAPEREPVKIAIALLGILRGAGDRDLLMTLGRHDELTLFAAVALQNTEPAPIRTLLELGRYVEGWGRVHVVHRLADARDDQVRAWLLREGWRNGVMHEYTALACATGGDLVGALRLPFPDAPLMLGAGAILDALIRGRGGPAEAIGDYADGPEAAELYLRHLLEREPELDHAPHARAIRDFVDEDEGESADPLLGWPQRRRAVVELADAVLALPRWEARVRAGLASRRRDDFERAAEAARAVGVDPWEAYYGRMERGVADASEWFSLMRTEDPEQLARAVRLAEARIPLEKIATGPAREMGWGKEFEAHDALDWVLQELHRLPGAGWALIRAGVRSPTLRNRHMAIRALRAWDPGAWPDEARSLFTIALAEEPDDKVRESLRRLLAGEPDEDDEDNEGDDPVSGIGGGDAGDPEPWRG
jgi:hypothetical protein